MSKTQCHNLSSHLEMVHDLNTNERSDYLKRAILCASTQSVYARYQLQQWRPNWRTADKNMIDQ